MPEDTPTPWAALLRTCTSDAEAELVADYFVEGMLDKLRAVILVDVPPLEHAAAHAYVADRLPEWRTQIRADLVQARRRMRDDAR